MYLNIDLFYFSFEILKNYTLCFYICYNITKTMLYILLKIYMII